MSVVDIGDDDGGQAEDLKGCSVAELNGMYLSAARNGDWPRIERLLAAGAELDYAGGGALSAATDMGHIDVARKLLARGLNAGRSRQEALVDAAFAGREDIVRFLINEVRADPAFDDSTALFTAVVNNKPGVTRLLLEKGAFPGAHKGTLLCIALSHSFEEVAAALLEAGADPRKHHLGRNAYEWAAQAGLRDFSQKLRDWGGTDVYMSPGFFRRQSLAELRGRYDERQRHTGFHLAAQAGCFDIIRDKILSTPGETMRPEDLLKREPGAPNVLAVLGDTGQLAIAFDARLWAGRKEEALKVLEKASPVFQGQVDAAALAAEIDRRALKARARVFSLKPKAP